jgi:hypothetical protein
MENPEHPFVGVECFRGSAKTTIARATLAKRISYAMTRTGLAVGANQAHAIRTIRWLKLQIEQNKDWTDFFGLRQGKKWTDDWIEVINTQAECAINLVALGITGSTRGLNLDDYRPDFIMVDDPCDEENTNTEAQREKTSSLFFGSLQPALAPPSENPNTKLVLLQTGLHKEDLIHSCHKDPTFKTIKLPIFKYNHHGEPTASTWPERWGLEELLAKKKGYTQRRQLHIWLREYECKITSPETAIFNTQMLRYYEHAPENMYVYCGIDPASSEAKDAHKAAIVFWGFANGNAYLLDYWAERGKNPEEIWNAFFSRAMKWRPLVLGVESIAYQKMLAWYFKERMRQLNYYVAVREIKDRRAKADRITQAHTGLLYNGWLYVREDQTEYVTAMEEYNGTEDNDLLDAGAMGLSMRIPALQGNYIEGEAEELRINEDEMYGKLELVGGCP